VIFYHLSICRKILDDIEKRIKRIESSSHLRLEKDILTQLSDKLEEQRLFLEEESKKLDSQPSLNEDKIINAVLALDEDEEQRFLKQMMKGYFERAPQRADLLEFLREVEHTWEVEKRKHGMLQKVLKTDTFSDSNDDELAVVSEKLCERARTQSRDSKDNRTHTTSGNRPVLQQQKLTRIVHLSKRHRSEEFVDISSHQEDEDSRGFSIDQRMQESDNQRYEVSDQRKFPTTQANSFRNYNNSNIDEDVNDDTENSDPPEPIEDSSSSEGWENASDIKRKRTKQRRKSTPLKLNGDSFAKKRRKSSPSSEPIKKNESVSGSSIQISSVSASPVLNSSRCFEQNFKTASYTNQEVANTTSSKKAKLRDSIDSEQKDDSLKFTEDDVGDVPLPRARSSSYHESPSHSHPRSGSTHNDRMQPTDDPSPLYESDERNTLHNHIASAKSEPIDLT
jgi:hypothetical protein